MNSEFFRVILYPLGFLASIFFTLRFFVQWIQSEKKKRSHVTKNFWVLSLVGNVIMTVHALIQLQYPLCLIQSFNGTVAWRNLDLMRKKPKSLKTTVVIMTLTLLFLSLLFVAEGLFFHSLSWMRAPSFLGLKDKATVPYLWHILGFAAMILFASRFWVQWWLAEKNQKSHLGKSFWWLSLAGAVFSLIYFIRLHDLVNILGYSVGILPYFRNLFLLKNETKIEPTAKSESIFLFAGEQSGDLIGGRLVEEVKRERPSLKIWGVGGDEMKNAGMESFSDISKFHVMGFSEVLKALPRLYGEFRKIKKHILKERPEVCVFIDYPEFNMKMASSLKKAGYSGKLVHYVCPSVWAWRKKRVFHLAKTLDMLLTILPFEKKYFKNTELPVTYVGHPLVSAIQNYSYQDDWKQRCNIASEKPLIALFPGSRKSEIHRNLPLQLEAIKGFTGEYQIAISVARPELENEIRKIAKNDFSLIPFEYRYELMKSAFSALATSGTVILELGLHQVPTIATYKLGNFNYLLGRYIFRIRLPFYTLVNIICEKEVFPEFIHKTISPEKIAEALTTLLERRESCVNDCERLHALLRNQNASKEAAVAITGILS